MKDIINRIDIILNEKGEKWSGKVKTSWTSSPGLFTKSAGVISKELISQSSDLKTAMSRLNFYRNRSGKNLSDERKAELEKVKDLLQKGFK